MGRDYSGLLLGGSVVSKIQNEIHGFLFDFLTLRASRAMEFCWARKAIGGPAAVYVFAIYSWA